MRDARPVRDRIALLVGLALLSAAILVGSLAKDVTAAVDVSFALG